MAIDIILNIQSKIEKELSEFIKSIKNKFSDKKTTSVLFDSIENFLLRKGKRFRPTFFILSYLGFSKKPQRNLYTTAIAFELLHDFLLVHDDIIDKSSLRRGQPSMHKIFEKAFKNKLNKRFDGSDLAIVSGDILYAIAIDSFFSINETAWNKEKAFKKFIESAIWTELGEFQELIYTLKSIDNITQSDIYQIYTMKTAYYSCAYPLSIGAILAGADKKQEEILFDCGISFGKAFQIKDDIIGIFGKENDTGKSSFTDLKEDKKTILIWFAYNNASKMQKEEIKQILSKGKNITYNDLLKMREILINTGAFKYAKNQINLLLKNLEKKLKLLSMKAEYKNIILDYFREILFI